LEPAARMMSTPDSSGASACSKAICCRCAIRMILFDALRCVRSSMTGCSWAASSAMSLRSAAVAREALHLDPAGRGDGSRICVVAPTRPISSPPLLTTAEGTMRPAQGRDLLESADAHRLQCSGRERWIAGEVQIGREVGEGGIGDGVGEGVGAEVELVVADGRGLDADPVVDLDVGRAGIVALVVLRGDRGIGAGGEEGAGDEVVAARQDQRVGVVVRRRRRPARRGSARSDRRAALPRRPRSAAKCRR
jgi:hypothetical protein